MKHQSQLLLIGESFSPWTKKTRWALEHCGLAYDFLEYTPTLSEPGLRWRLRQWFGNVSVPILLADDQNIHGSWAIARYANQTTDDERLGDMSAISPWNDLSESALAEGRTSVVRCILNNNQALEESLPKFLPKPLRRPMRFLARDAVQRLDRKYAHLLEQGSLRHALVRTQDGLAQAEGDYLLGRFSYADIAMAVVIEVFAPIADTYPPLGPATQGCWNNSALAAEFEELLNWRDRLAVNNATSYSQFNLQFA